MPGSEALHVPNFDDIDVKFCLFVQCGHVVLGTPPPSCDTTGQSSVRRGAYIVHCVCVCWQPADKRRKRIEVRAGPPQEPPTPPSLSPYRMNNHSPMKSYKSGPFTKKL